MADFLIELSRAQFRRAYLLYIIEISHGEDAYFYIGQTGDNNYVTARPAFRRLAANLEDIGASTQNQVYRYIATKILGHSEAQARKAFSETVKQTVEDFLVESVVRMHIYKVEPFDPLVTPSTHKAIVDRVVLLEQYVIQAFQASGKSLINKNIASLPEIARCPYPELLTRIKSDFGM